jgi:hypothetical protein
MRGKFFGMSTPRDMLEKAKREHEKMKSELTIDTVFNFFVTAYHVTDYVKARGVNKTEIANLSHDTDFKMCKHICEKGKHIMKRDTYKTQYEPGALFGKGCFGKIEFAERESYIVVDGNVPVDVLDLSERLITKWEVFFSRNGI